MAEQLSPGMENAPEPPPNTVNRTEMFKSALSQMYALEQKEKSLTKTHLSAIRKEKSEIKKSLRKDLKITAGVFDARYHAYRMEAEAIARGDTATQETLRELFSISPVGTQMDLVDALEANQGNGAAA